MARRRPVVDAWRRDCAIPWGLASGAVGLASAGARAGLRPARLPGMTARHATAQLGWYVRRWMGAYRTQTPVRWSDG